MKANSCTVGSIATLYCPAHGKQLLNLVCLSLQCASCGLICRKCRSEKHAQHQTITIGQLDEKIGKARDDEWVQQSLTKGTRTIKEAQEKCYKRLEQAKEEIISLISELKGRMDLFFSAEENMLRTQSQRCQSWKTQLPKLTPQDTFDAANKKVANIVNSLHTFERSAEQHVAATAQQLQFVKIKQRETETAINQLVEQARTLLRGLNFDSFAMQQAKVINGSIQPSVLQLVPIWEQGFSQTLKHSDIEVSGTVIKRARSTAGGYRCAFGKTAIDCYPPARLFACRLKIASQTNKLHCGIAIERSVVDRDYWQGHEDLVRSNGYVFSKSDKSMNNKETAVTFAMGDVVELYMDTGSMTLRISCRGHETSMKVETPRAGDVYRFVVYLWEQSSTVEMLI